MKNYKVSFNDYMTYYEGICGELDVKANSKEEAREKADKDLYQYCGWGNYEICKVWEVGE